MMQQCGTEGKQSKMDPSPGCETPTATRLQGTAMKSPPFLLRHRAQHRGPNQDTSLDPGHQSRGLLGSLWELSACHCPAPGWLSSPPALLEKGCSCPSPAGTSAPGSTTDTVTALRGAHRQLSCSASWPGLCSHCHFCPLPVPPMSLCAIQAAQGCPSTETPLVPVQDWGTKSHPFILGSKERLKTAWKGSGKQR